MCISWRGSKGHRSATGAAGQGLDCAGHKGEAVSRGRFILVHISSPMACRSLWLSGEGAEIAALALARWTPLLLYHPPKALAGPPLRFVTNTRTSSGSDSSPHAATHSHHEEGSESMVVCLEREEQEHRLQENHKKRVALSNRPAAIRATQNRFIGFGIQKETKRKPTNVCQCVTYKKPASEEVYFTSTSTTGSSHV